MEFNEKVWIRVMRVFTYLGLVSAILMRVNLGFQYAVIGFGMVAIVMAVVLVAYMVFDWIRAYRLYR